MLAGFRSRCTTFASCAARRAAATCRMILNPSCSGNAPLRFNRAESVSPRNNFIVKKQVSPRESWLELRSYVGQTFGCATCRARSTSFSKRSLAPASSDASIEMVFSATRSPFTKLPSSASYTSPWPPLPMKRTMRYRPATSSPSWKRVCRGAAGTCCSICLRRSASSSVRVLSGWVSVGSTGPGGICSSLSIIEVATGLRPPRIR